jgi:aminocarboxymuconate-semialdehyde decarboxylase
MRNIDVHAHCIPAQLMAALETEGAALGIELTDDRRAVVAGGKPTIPIRDDLVDFEARLAAMDSAGIEVQILSSWIDLTGYGLDQEQGERWSRRANEALAEEAGRDPGRFLALATAPLQAPELAAAELRYATEQLGMVGVEIATRVGDADLVSAGLDAFWATAEELGSLVLLHPMDPLPGIDLQRHFLANTVGRPAETTIAAARLIFAGVFDRHPGLRVCVVHGGGFLPYQVGRMQRAWEAKPAIAATDLATPPLEVAQHLYFDTIVHNPQALRYLIDLVGAERIMLGTDYPFEAGDLDPLPTIDAIPNLTDEERRRIVSGTAESLLDR